MSNYSLKTFSLNHNWNSAFSDLCQLLMDFLKSWYLNFVPKKKHFLFA
uniref:Uncharacterized protein n=1 Tax=Rhizophora mucronata TaxID=61149 RepID=A0A2P2Q405_RHIMU